MKKANSPQVVRHADAVNSLDPGRNHVDFFELLEQLEKEYDNKI